jgi:hypothetical protein
VRVCVVRVCVVLCVCVCVCDCVCVLVFTSDGFFITFCFDKALRLNAHGFLLLFIKCMDYAKDMRGFVQLFVVLH